MWLYYRCKQRLFVDKKLLLVSGFVRVLLVSILLIFLWFAIIWSSWIL